MNLKVFGLLLLIIIMVLIRVVNLGYMPETHDTVIMDEGRAYTIARNVAERILALPIYYDLTLNDVQRICDIIIALGSGACHICR